MDLETLAHLLVAAAKSKAQEPVRIHLEVLPESIQLTVQDATREEKVYHFERGDRQVAGTEGADPCPQCGGSGMIPREL